MEWGIDGRDQYSGQPARTDPVHYPGVRARARGPLGSSRQLDLPRRRRCHDRDRGTLRPADGATLGRSHVVVRAQAHRRRAGVGARGARRQTALFEDRLAAAFDVGALAQVLLETQTGHVWLVRFGFLVLLAAFLLLHLSIERRADWRAARGEAVLLGAAALLPVAAAGHAAAVEPGTAPALALDGLHLIVAGVWVGGSAAGSPAERRGDQRGRRCSTLRGPGGAALLAPGARRGAHARRHRRAARVASRRQRRGPRGNELRPAAPGEMLLIGLVLLLAA